MNKKEFINFLLRENNAYYHQYDLSGLKAQFLDQIQESEKRISNNQKNIRELQSEIMNLSEAIDEINKILGEENEQ